MSRIAVATDSNSGITQALAKQMGIGVLPMPFYINGQLYFEDITLTQQEFYRRLDADADISTSQPSPGDVTDFWDGLLANNDQVIYIPMSSGRDRLLPDGAVPLPGGALRRPCACGG